MISVGDFTRAHHVTRNEWTVSKYMVAWEQDKSEKEWCVSLRYSQALICDSDFSFQFTLQIPIPRVIPTIKYFFENK